MTMKAGKSRSAKGSPAAALGAGPDPAEKPGPVVKRGEFPFAAMCLEHAHIHGMCQGLIEAGATLRWVFDRDPEKVRAFQRAFPQAETASSEEQVLEDRELRLVAAAAVPSRRGQLGCMVMEHGKDYFTDKAPFTEMGQLEEARRTAAATGRRYMVYYSERLHSECSVYAGRLIAEGAIGRVIQLLGLGPHRLNAGSRPAWFFRKSEYGGILCDIGSHQVEQFLFFSGARAASVVHARVANYDHPQHPELEDFGEAVLVADNGASCYLRVDWFTPDGLSTWGDGRTFIVGTEGTIEMRKYVNLATQPSGDHLFLVNAEGEHHLELAGKIGYPFFGRLILDCLNRTESAMTQEHAFNAAELALRAQALADSRR
jgi:predicted dehydrogenase